MKKVIGLILLCVLLFCSSIASAEGVWKITSLNWQPYSGAEMRNYGNSIQKLMVLLNKENIKLQVDFYPWSRAQAIALKDEYVGYFPAWPDEVKDGFVASPPIDNSEIAVMRTNEFKLDYKNIPQLFLKYRVGIVRTYAYPEFVTKAMKKHPSNIVPSPSEKALVKMLNAGRFDCAITDPNVMIYLANQQGYNNIVVDRALQSVPLVMALKKDQYTNHKLRLLEKLLIKD